MGCSIICRPVLRDCWIASERICMNQQEQGSDEMTARTDGAPSQVAPQGTIIFSRLCAAHDQATDALPELRKVTLGLLGRLYGSVSATTHPLPETTGLLNYADRWQLPPFPKSLDSRELTIDVILLRAEMLWIHLTCLQDPKLPIPAALYEQIKDFDAQVTASFVDPNNPSNPFQGMVQTLILAGNSHAKFADRADAAIHQALASGETKEAWRILRDEVGQVAVDAVIGFPQASALFERLSSAA